jgi:transcription antitermination factor NusG
MALQWYALRSKQRKEEAVWKHARDQGFDIFYPRLRVNPVNPRARKIRPYFPGYLFVRADLDLIGLSALQFMPYSHGLVCFGGEPAIVPENLIIAIRQRVEEIAKAGGENLDGLHKGDVVQINYGPFEGFQAIFDEKIPGSERVRILLQLLDSRNVPVELSSASISRKK